MVAPIRRHQTKQPIAFYVKAKLAPKVGTEPPPEAYHFVASAAVTYVTKNPLAGAIAHMWLFHSPLTDLWRSRSNYQESPDVFNQDTSKVNILSPVYESESTRRVPSSSQQGRRRGGTTSKKGSEMVKVVWKSGKEGGKKRPTCPKGFRLRRVGKRLMCVKS